MSEAPQDRGGPLRPTPSHTVGPFYGYALPFPGGGELAPAGHPETVTLHGRVYDGAGEPLPDALLELWQANPDGTVPQRAGSLRQDASTGAHLGRSGVHFTGFGRVGTDGDGSWAARTLVPGARGAHAPYVSVCVFARGLLHHLYTRLYFPQHAAEHDTDPLLASLPPERRESLVAVHEGNSSYRFDIRLQGERETTFLEFR